MSDTLNQAETCYLDACQHIVAQQYDEAENLLDRALTLAPDFAEALANLAYLQDKKGQYQNAIALYQRAIDLRPDCVQISLNFGAMLMKQKQFQASESVYRQALSQDTQHAATWSNLGVLLASLKRETEAEQCYRQALAIAPGYDKARFNLSYLLLRQGHYEEGLSCMEARAWQDLFSAYFQFPRWNGESLTGKAILITFEGGCGDMIMFSRYAQQLRHMHASKISLICQPELQTLLSSLQDIDEVFSYHDDLPVSGWDYWVLPMSLPYWCGTRADTIPARIPYLFADPSREQAFSAVLSAPGYKVGLAWKGNPLFDNDSARSLASLGQLDSILRIPDIRFISLQKGDTSTTMIEQAHYYGVELFGERLQDFADTAAVICQLDLVISVDTAVAHLAGAMGIPCWLLLPDYCCDWRWGAGSADTPWYPLQMRLFRQHADGDWNSVIQAMAALLPEYLYHLAQKNST